MSETEKTIFDEIWTFIEDRYGPVPPYFKYILKYCGFNNGISIATIDDGDIQYMVSEVKNGNVSNYFKSINGNDTGDISKTILEGSTKNMENFEFCRGHVKFLMSIVEFLKKYAEENGPDSFTIEKKKKKLTINKPKAKGNVPSVPRKRAKYSEEIDDLVHISEMDDDIVKQKKVLLKKMLGCLKFNTSKLYEENKSKIQEKMAADQLIIVKMGKSKDNNPESEKSEDSTKIAQYEGAMICPYCSTKINVFYGTNWKSTNFDRHLTLIHPKTSPETVASDTHSEETRRKSDDDKTTEKDASMETNVAKKSLSNRAREDATNQPSTSRQILGQITNQRKSSEAGVKTIWKDEREQMWNKFF